MKNILQKLDRLIQLDYAGELYQPYDADSFDLTNEAADEIQRAKLKDMGTGSYKEVFAIPDTQWVAKINKFTEIYPHSDVADEAEAYAELNQRLRVNSRDRIRCAQTYLVSPNISVQERLSKNDPPPYKNEDLLQFAEDQGLWDVHAGNYRFVGKQLVIIDFSVYSPSPMNPLGEYSNG